MDGHCIGGNLSQDLSFRRIHIQPKLGLQVRHLVIDGSYSLPVRRKDGPVEQFLRPVLVKIRLNSRRSSHRVFDRFSSSGAGTSASYR